MKRIKPFFLCRFRGRSLLKEHLRPSLNDCESESDIAPNFNIINSKHIHGGEISTAFNFYRPQTKFGAR